LAQSGAAELIARDIQNDLGGIDILINNAGVQGPIGKIEDVDFSAWQQTFAVNLFAPARLSQLLIPQMRRRGGGKIINISGGGATSPRPNFSAYGVSKCALVRLTETLAHELTGSGIDVNAVAPGAMNTRMLEEVIAAGPRAAAPEYEAAMSRACNGGDSPAWAAELVIFLCSRACDGITGRLISAVWDDWKNLPIQRDNLIGSERYTLRRVK
jgi:3-oxoacyl-[acyl-carrier protein] reductase